MPDHKFRLGQKVRLNRGYPYRLVSEGAYEIVRRMPFARDRGAEEGAKPLRMRTVVTLLGTRRH